MSRLPRLRTLLGVAGLILLLLPLAVVQWLRVYESALVRQTESELLAQGALLSALAGALAEDSERQGLPPGVGPLLPGALLSTPTSVVPMPEVLDEPAPAAATPDPADWLPFQPRLDLRRDAILPPPPPVFPATLPPDATALAWGRRLGPALREAQKHLLAGVRLTDARGVVIASTAPAPGPLALGGDLTVFPEIRDALAGRVAHVLRARGHKATPGENPAIARGAAFRVVVALPVIAPTSRRVVGAVLLMRTPSTLGQVLASHGLEVALTLAGLAAAALLVGALALRRVVGPLRAIVRQARAAAEGRLDAVQPLPHPGALELAELSDALAGMARRLEARAAYIETFARHVAHEFKTPLASLNAAHEMLTDDAEAHGWPAAPRRVLEVAQAETDRLRRLTQSLLALARAEHSEPSSLHRGATRLNPWAESITSRWRERGLDAVFTRCAKAPADPFVALSGEGLDAVFEPLYDNARVYGGAGVCITLSLEPTASDGQLVLNLADTGPGIGLANREKAFEPFFTTGRTRGGTGLGLPIARALLRAHGGELAFQAGDGWRGFRLTIPAASAPG